jgi:hypothetical protein
MIKHCAEWSRKEHNIVEMEGQVQETVYITCCACTAAASVTINSALVLTILE